MNIINLSPPLEWRISVNHTSAASKRAIDHAMIPVPEEFQTQLTAWYLPSTGIGGMTHKKQHFVFEVAKYQKIEIGIIYPAKGAGSLEIALTPISGTDKDEIMFEIGGYNDEKLEWCKEMLDILSRLYLIPIGAGGFAYDC